MRTKVCTGACGVRLPLDEVHFAFKNKKDRTFRHRCKSCHNERARSKYTDSQREGRAEGQRRRRTLKRQAMLRYLKGRSCIDCGEADLIVLQFDHVKGEKLADISRIILSGTMEALLVEIEKCEIVCANCHARRTAARAGWSKLADIEAL